MDHKRLVKADLPWRYVGVTHEYLTADGEGPSENLDALSVRHFADGGSRHDKFERDAALLAADLRADPGNTRTVFYLAQTMRDMGRIDQAVELYRRRTTMGGWDEEVYYAHLQTGILLADAGDWPAGLQALVRAWEHRPARLEACYEIISRLRLRGDYHTAHAFASAVLDRPVPEDWLFVQPWVYGWGILFEYSITAYWTGNHNASVQACDRLLALPDLPATYRDQTHANRRFAQQALLQGTAILNRG